ncbi:MAG: putative porin [Verrucomicrobia bacterium]|nr:putative porin [Verrucomicrobiota bacterium]
MNIKRLIGAAAIIGTVAGWGGASTARAQSADTLIDMLVDKGVLTLDEARQLRRETDRDFNRAYAAKSGMPEWITALKMGGDFRGRFEGFYGDNSSFHERDRFRYRLRFGVTALMLENFEAGFRLGSGDIDTLKDWTGADPISNNQTLQNNASKKAIFLDLAYGTWHMVNSSFMKTDLTIGKMQNPFVFSPIVFDHDYTPEGAAGQFVIYLNHDPAKAQALDLNLGAFVLDENKADDDPYLLGAQLRWRGRFSRPETVTGFNASAGVAFLSVQHVERLTTMAVPNVNRGNSPDTASLHFNPVIADGSLAYTLESFPMYNAPFPITLSGTYMVNPGAGRHNEGYTVGVTFGKAGKNRLWQVSYAYRHLEANAWYEECTDSDFGAYYAGPGGGYGAGTNVRGHVAQLQYSPANVLTLGITAFVTELIDPPPVADNDSGMLRIQADAVWKF